MSLVNKMLRDLDARRAGETERAALPAAVTPLAARQAPPPVWPKLVVAGLIAVASSAVAWRYWGASSVTPPPQAAAPAPAPVVVAAPEVVPAPVLAAVSPAPTFPAAATEAAPAATGKGGELQPERDLNRQSAPNHQVLKPEPKTKQKIEPKPEAKAESKPESKAAPKHPPPVTASPAGSLVKAPPGTLPSAEATSRIDKQERVPSSAERADAFYRQGREAQRAGRADEALTSYQAALAVFPEQTAARQALAALLIEGRHWDAAEQVLREGVELPATRLASTLTLARLLVERSQAAAALDLMEKQAASGEHSAEYQGFLAVLLNRAGRAHEAAERYQVATRLAPGEARWWAGLGISLEADGQGAAAREAYLKARSLPGLPPELVQHVEQRLR